MSLTAALSTMFLTVNRLIALSLGTQRLQFEQRMNETWPRPFLLRPPFLLFLVYSKPSAHPKHSIESNDNSLQMPQETEK